MTSKSPGGVAIFRGADSRVVHMAAMATANAVVQYQAGASGFPVARNSQVMEYWVVLPI